MKLKFKHQPYQSAAVEAVADCFAGQPRVTGMRCRIAPDRPPADGDGRLSVPVGAQTDRTYATISACRSGSSSTPA